MITFKPVDASNYLNVVNLKLHPHQENFVSPNWQSLLEAIYEEDKNPFAIYHDSEVVGFILCSYYPADEAYPVDSWWVERLMIDKVWQGKGIGRQALLLFLEEFKQSTEVKDIRIGVEPDNDGAISLYESLNFKKEGIVDGETVYVKILD